MGVCLCKDKVVDGHSDSPQHDSSNGFGGGDGGGVGGGAHHALSRQNTNGSGGNGGGQYPTRHSKRMLSETVDGLVIETLHVIGSIVDKWVFFLFGSMISLTILSAITLLVFEWITSFGSVLILCYSMCLLNKQHVFYSNYGPSD